MLPLTVRKNFDSFQILKYFSDYSPKDKKRDRTKKELKKNTESNEMITDNTQIPANDYQKTVINYQNDDECFLGKNYLRKICLIHRYYKQYY